MGFKPLHLLSLAAFSAVFACGAQAQPAGLAVPSDKADTTAWKRYFAVWETASPDDAQLWIDQFNYYFNLSRQSGITLCGNEESDGSAGEEEETGWICESATYDQTDFNKAIGAIDSGIARHPDRLDMYLGRATAFLYAERYEPMAETLCSLLDRAAQNAGLWIDTDGVTALSIVPELLISDVLQDYVEALLDAVSPAHNDPAAAAFQRLTRRETEYCPSSPVALNNLAVCCLRAGSTDEALALFIRAHEADPSDALLVCNIGCLYASRNDRQNASEWWNKLLNFPDEYYREMAAELLRRLEESAPSNSGH